MIAAVCRAFRGWANNALAELPLVMVVGGIKMLAPDQEPALPATLESSASDFGEAGAANAMLAAGMYGLHAIFSCGHVLSSCMIGM